ncbi:ethanolamine utilization protein EutJ [Clostridium formicaceticum]|uniref:Chaperone protein DnaK n=1 Tax=Clostridium formicaceticum TaxID=1497 RepID=A0AAC9WG63_9CLOT|nr:ethanolamine utilization protein EutJ [Clostridium formicaceticum]AOY77127.1 ethanolamine utilization protein EutJ [Clostridium formicaceticum]ARE87642.1 Chaperone protein DnaK [Clostridium formicaceticum]
MLEKANAIVKATEEKMIKGDTEHLPIEICDDIKVGVDLGTSNIVLTVLDKKNRPIIGAMQSANVVKDGIVVDYIKAVDIVHGLKEKVEKRINKQLCYAATAIPPGISTGNIKVITNVVESCGFEVINVVDEPEAAARVLNIDNGAVVDVGGGTTGISIIEKGQVTLSVDEPTGGTHLTLVVAGNYGISFEEAEKFKLDPKNYHKVFPVVRPVVEKMADIVLKSITGFDIERIYLVGGTCCLDGIEKVFEKYIGIETIKPYNPLLVTPIGISMSVS